MRGRGIPVMWRSMWIIPTPIPIRVVGIRIPGVSRRVAVGVGRVASITVVFWPPRGVV